LSLFSTIQEKLGWNARANEHPLIAMLRPMILGIMGKSNDATIIDEAQRRFERHLTGDLIDPNIRGTVYAIVSRYGNEQTQDALRMLYDTADMNEEKVRLLRAMGQSLHVDLVKKTLNFIFDSVR
jgi:phage gp29-like protein